MRIGLIDVDSHNFPNLPLMKLSEWHKRQGDSVEWYSPMFSGHMDKVYLSKVFSFSQDYPYCIDADEIIRGGSGYCIKVVDGKEVYIKENDICLPPEIEHIYPDYSIYQTSKAYGFLTRGCPRGCGFCHVATKEGRKSIKVADLEEFWNGQNEIVLLDPNLLAYKGHMELLEQLVKTNAIIELNQGWDIRLVNDDNLELIKMLKLRNIHLAWDKWEERDVVEPKLRRFAEKTGFHRNNGRVLVYILVNYNTTLDQDIYRIQLCRELKFSPYPMIYDKAHADPVYKKLQRWCNNFIFWQTETFEDYDGGKRAG